MDETPPADHASIPVPAQVIPERPLPRRTSSGWRTWLLLLVFLALGGSLLLNVLLAGMVNLSADASEGRVQEKFYNHQATGQNKIAVISIEGTITDAEGFIKHQIDKARKDDAVKAVVLRIDSPGGTVAASDALYCQLKKLREQRALPVVVSMGALAASGGYYLAMAVGDQPDTIFAEPATWTGSIGVMIPHYDLSQLLDKVGVKDDTLASHHLKTILSMSRPMSEEDRKIVQELIDEAFARFKEIVRSGRPRFAKDPAALDKVATGQVFTAQQAKRQGLVDQIGFLDDAVERAIALARLDAKDVRVVKYRREQGLASLLTGAESRGPAANEWSLLMAAATPRAYYLWSMLPEWISTRGPRD